MKESVKHTDPEKRLPAELFEKASIRRGEYAWPIDDVPKVIEAARAANLVNLGGQLQFRVPGEGTAECWWVKVDTYQSVSTSLPWSERVEKTAKAAVDDFARLLVDFDFFEEGRKMFSKWFDELIRMGYDPRKAMYFVWCLEVPDPEPDAAGSVELR